MPLGDNSDDTNYTTTIFQNPYNLKSCCLRQNCLVGNGFLNDETPPLCGAHEYANCINKFITFGFWLLQKVISWLWSCCSIDQWRIWFDCKVFGIPIRNQLNVHMYRRWIHYFLKLRKKSTVQVRFELTTLIRFPTKQPSELMTQQSANSDRSGCLHWSIDFKEQLCAFGMFVSNCVYGYADISLELIKVTKTLIDYSLHDKYIHMTS